MPDLVKLEIVTPEGTVFSEDVEMVTLPAVMGQMGVYPLHTPVTTKMAPGEIIVRKNGRDIVLVADDGLIEVTAHRVAVLTAFAVAADRLDEAIAEEERRRAEARLGEKLSGKQAATLNASLAHALARLRVKQRQRR